MIPSMETRNRENKNTETFWCAYFWYGLKAWKFFAKNYSEKEKKLRNKKKIYDSVEFVSREVLHR